MKNELVFSDLITIDALEKRYLIFILDFTKGNIMRTSKLFGRSPKTIYIKMRIHHINVEEIRAKYKAPAKRVPKR